jgi:hypothetical protein
MTDKDSPQGKRCASCGGTYYLAFFARSHNTKETHSAKPEAQQHRNRCIGCEARTKRKSSIDRNLRMKAIATRRRHGLRLKDRGMIKRPDDLEEVYGWSLDRMINDIRRIIADGCPYCQMLVNVTELGLGNVSLDIINPDKRPHYSTNVNWCCIRCNSEKQQISSDVWGERLSMWDLWRRNQERLKVNPESFGFLSYNDEAEQTLPLWR